VAVAKVDDAGVADYRFFVQGTAAPNLTLDMVPAEFGPDVRALHVGTLGLVVEPMASTLAQLVQREFGRRLVMVDPNIRPALPSDPRYRDRLEAVISRSTIVKASEADLAWLYPGLEHVAACDRITAQGIRLVIATLGAEGAYGSTGRARVRVRAPLVHVVDTIGARDAFGAAVLAWLHNRDALRPDLRLNAEQLESLLAFACLVASLTCARAGAEPPWRSELDQSA
jgi:fructokinase